MVVTNNNSPIKRKAMPQFQLRRRGRESVKMKPEWSFMDGKKFNHYPGKKKRIPKAKLNNEKLSFVTKRKTIIPDEEEHDITTDIDKCKDYLKIKKQAETVLKHGYNLWPDYHNYE